MTDLVAEMTKRRNERGMGLREVESEVGISFSTLARYERGGPATPKSLKRIKSWLDGTLAEKAPIPMRIPCPRCGELHIDEGEFETKPHHTHACQHCGEVWRPAVVHTVGVRFLPGFKNAI